MRLPSNGAVAQLGERLTGSQEVRGSIPLSSTSSRLHSRGVAGNRGAFRFFSATHVAPNARMTLRAWRFALVGYVVLIGTISGLAYAKGLPRTVLSAPGFDKVLHFLLLGGASLLARKATDDARLGRSRVPLGPFIVGLCATTDECVQAFVPTRSFDLGDMAANLAGVVVLGWLGGLGRKAEPEQG